MTIIRGKRGSALLLVYLFLVVFLTIGIAVFSSTMSESLQTKRNAETTQAFWLAEAGLNGALDALRTSWSTTNLPPTAMGNGYYSALIAGSGMTRTVNAWGYVPDNVSPRAARQLQATITRYIPANFYGNAIFSAKNITLQGNAYVVNGDVTYATTINDTAHVTGALNHDLEAAPLARLDFPQLLSISQGQGNVYTQSHNKLINVATGHETPFPSDFWHAPGIPNVVYVIGDLQLNGNIGTIGGFFVVAGDVINTPDITQDAVINGNGTIKGCVYTRGTFRVNGGAGRLNVDGGVWGGLEARLNGNATVSYNKEYMDAIQALNIGSTPQITSWVDTQNPY